MVAWRQELIVNERCSQDEEGKLSKTGDFMVVFISGVSSKKKSEGRKKKKKQNSSVPVERCWYVTQWYENTHQKAVNMVFG